MAGRPVTDQTFLPESGGSVQVANAGNHIELRATAGLGPGAPPVVLTRLEAEWVAKALSSALAHLRGEESRPAAAEPLEAAVKRKAKA